jgi:hypothetical protein
MKKAIVLAGILMTSSLWADVTIETMNKTYIPSFWDWSQIILNGFTQKGDIVWSTINMIPVTETTYRYKVMIAYSTKYSFAYNSALNTKNLLQAQIANQCFIWTKEGYPISISDFDFSFATMP